MHKPRKYTHPEPSRPARNGRWAPTVPDVASIDVLASLMDDELSSRFHAIDEARHQLLETRIDLRPWEEELAYVRREQMIRRGRRENHDRFLREGAPTLEEWQLPTGDFDNLAFVYAASNGRPPRWS